MSVPSRCGSFSLIKSPFAPLMIALAVGQAAYAVIIPTGDVTPIYDNSDPWDPAGGILVVGDTGNGTLEINSGSSVNSLITGVGNQTTGNGVLTVTGANSTLNNAAGLVSIAGSGTGELRIENGGVANAGAVSMAGGATALSEATIAGAGSQLNATSIMVVGGAINIFNGDIGPGGDATLNVNSGGSVTVGDAATPLASGLVISDADGPEPAGGALTVFGGGQISLAGQAVIGQGAGEFGWATLTGEGAHLNAGGNVVVGSSGTGHLTLEAGADLDTGNKLNIGAAAGSTGTTTVTGSGSTLDTGDDLNIGFSGDGTLNILDGATVRTGILSDIGSQAGSTGAVTVNGAGSHWVTDYAFLEPGTVIIINSGLTVGALGDGTLTAENGGRVSSGIAYVASGEGSTGTVKVTGAGSQWDVPDRLQVGGGGTGEIKVEDGGVFNSGGESYIGSGSEGTVTVTGAESEWNHKGSLIFGFAGSGTGLVENGGLMTNTANTALGFFPDSVGEVTVSGPGSRWENDGVVTVGFAGTGTLEVEEGGVAEVQELAIGADAAGEGEVTVRNANSQLRISDGLVVGGSLFSEEVGGPGTLNIESGGQVRLNDTGTLSTIEALDISGDGPMPMDGVTMTVLAGGTVNNGASAVVGTNASEYGTAIVTGAGATWHNGGTLTIGFLGTGTLVIDDGGVVTGADGMIGEFAVSSGDATVNGAGSRWDLTGDLDVGLAGAGTLTIETGGVVSVAGTSTIGVGGPVDGTGGKIDLTGGRFEFGTMSLGDFSVINGVSGALAGVVDAEAEFFGFNTVDDLDDVDFLGGFTNLAPAVDTSEVTFSSYSNSGIISGTGVSDFEITNNASGTIEVFVFDNMEFNANGVNNGRYEIQAGRLRFSGQLTNNATIVLANDLLDDGQLDIDGDLDNESTGTIRGGGRIAVGGTFTNRGAMNLNEGTMEIRGAFVNEPGGSVLTTAGAITTFFDSVEHNGAAIETATGSSTVFRGKYSGAGEFTGDGLVEFEGPVNLGNSTAEVAFAGDVSLTDTAVTTVEIGGPLVGEFDRFNIDGEATIDGDLVVSLINGFTTSLGDVFEILIAASVLGEFDSVTLPGAGYELVYSATAVQLVATSALSGDYNNDGVVDAADYTVWRDNEGAAEGTLLNDFEGGPIGQAQYDAWVANFGSTLPSPAVAVPEPATAVLMPLAMLAGRASRR